MHEVPKRALFSTTLAFPGGMQIGVKGYGLVTEQKKGAYKCVVFFFSFFLYLSLPRPYLSPFILAFPPFPLYLYLYLSPLSVHSHFTFTFPSLPYLSPFTFTFPLYLYLSTFIFPPLPLPSLSPFPCIFPETS